MNDSARVARLFAAAGAVLVVCTCLLGQGLGVLGFAAYALLPWAVVFFAGPKIPDPWCVGGAGAAALAVELGVRLYVFLWPKGSTSALVLLFSPVIILAFTLGPGAALGWALGKLWRTGKPLARALAALAGAGAFFLITLGFARPELFPTTAYKNKKILDDIGSPRVVSGGDAFTSQVVSSSSSWFQPALGAVAEVDVDAAVIDPTDYSVRERFAFSDDGRRAWNWFSRLVKIEGKPAIAQTGGGFSEVGVTAFDGSPLWSYRPDSDLPATAMKVGDLDGDGAVEFYASSNRKVARLDGNGREVWSRPAWSPMLFAVAPRRGGLAGWVAAAEYRKTIRIWDENGAVVAELPWGDPPPVGLCDLTKARGILLSGPAARVIDLNGKDLLDVPVADMNVSNGLSVRFTAGGPVFVAVVAGAPRQIGRWRLRLLTEDGRLAYDEVFAKPPTIFTASRSDGAETLFVAADGLRALRPR